jgi:hypothetical protein
LSESEGVEDLRAVRRKAVLPHLERDMHVQEKRKKRERRERDKATRERTEQKENTMHLD